MSTELPQTGLGDHISKTVAAIMTPEFIEAEVASRISKLVADSVEHALRSYSDVGKLIKKAVEDALRVDRIDLPSYGSTVCAILKSQIETHVSDLVAGQLSQNMEELLGLAPKEVKLSDIAREMLSEHEGEKFGEVITVYVEEKFSSFWVYLDPDEARPHRDKYQCPHRLGVDENGRIFSATIADKDVKSTTHIGRSYGLEQKLRAYVACGTRIILDWDHVVTSIGD